MLIKRSHRVTTSDDVERDKYLVNQNRVQTAFFDQIHHFDEHDAWYKNLMHPRVSLAEYLTSSR